MASALVARPSNLLQHWPSKGFHLLRATKGSKHRVYFSMVKNVWRLNDSLNSREGNFID